MPTYDYHCSSCGHTFELRQTFASEPVTACPRCSRKVQRLFHAPAIIYKGSGFYTTDYKNNHTSSPDYSKDASSPKGPSKSEESTKDTKAESGHAAKKESAKESAPSEA